MNSQSESGNHSLCSFISVFTKCTFILYDCSEGETRQALIHNTVEFMAHLLSHSTDFLFFTRSLAPLQETCRWLLQSPLTLNPGISLLISLFRSCPLSSSLLYLVHLTINVIVDASSVSSPFASISDTNYRELLSLIQLILSDDSSATFLFPHEFLTRSLQSFVHSLPLRDRKPFLSPTASLLASLLAKHEVPVAIVNHFLLQQLKEAAELEGESALEIADAVQELLLQVVTSDVNIIPRLLQKMSPKEGGEKGESKEPISSPSAKRCRVSLFFPPNTSPVIFLVFLRLLTQITCKAEKTVFSSTELDTLIEFKEEAIRFFKERMMPLLDRAGVEKGSDFDNRVVFLICLEVCTSRLLEKEEAIRCELSRKILELAKMSNCWSSRGKSTPLNSTRSVSVIVFDRKGRSRWMMSCRSSTEANQTKLSDCEEEEGTGRI